MKIKVIEVWDSQGKQIGIIPADPQGDGNAYSVHRADAHSLLLAGVAPENIHLGMNNVEVFEEGDRGVARFEDGRQVRAKILIGADGTKSVARTFIHGDELNLVVVHSALLALLRQCAL